MHSVRIVGIAFDAQSSYLRGPALAPGRIREEILSTAYNPFAESEREVVGSRLSFGPILRPGSYEAIYPLACKELTGFGQCLFLGGDHSISFPLIQATHDTRGAFHILHFDAHGDLYDQLDGNPYSHACPFARVMERGLARGLTQVGIRTMTPHQREQAVRFGAEIITMQELDKFEPAAIPGPIYLSLDIDVIDPGFAPGVSHREAGGVAPATLIRWIQAIDQPIIGADLVEYNPLQDCRGITAALCYKLVKEILDAMIRNARN
ncbi:MAG: arginase family protein [Saprospiraceae bacterium]|nr:arginase family protein [Saprospiraceae bacterium]